MSESEMKKVKEGIVEQIESMDERDLKKVLNFLSELAKQKECSQGVN
ncbi:hypothetical protein [Hungatella hathewayi]|nr:hypothetical protein [Hungatella hathewayi]